MRNSALIYFSKRLQTKNSPTHGGTIFLFYFLEEALSFAMRRDLVRATVLRFMTPFDSALSSFWERRRAVVVASVVFLSVMSLRSLVRNEAISALASLLRAARFTSWRRDFFAACLFGIACWLFSEPESERCLFIRDVRRIADL